MRLGQIVAFCREYAAIITNVSILLLEKMATIALVFFCEGVISNLLGVSLYGKWLYSLNAIILLSSVTLIAGSEVVVPALVRHPHLRWKILSSVFLFRQVFAFFALLATLCYANFIVTDQDVRLMLTLLAFSLIFNEPFSVIANFYQATTSIGIVVAIRLAVLLLRVLLVSVAVLYSSYLIIYSTRAIEAMLLAISLSCVIYFRGGIWDWHKKVAVVMLSRGGALWVPLILMLIYMRIDRFFIEHYLGYEQLAMYGVASQMLEQGVLVLGIVVQSIAPMMLYGRRVKKIHTVCLGVLLVACILQLMGWLWLDDIVYIIFGKNYEIAAELAIMMLPALSFFAVDSVFMQRLYRDKKYLLLMCKWLLLSIMSAFNYWLLLKVFRSGDIYIVYIINALLMMITTMSIYLIHQSKDRFCKVMQ
ncbi:oligosaccharide flippase family protein [Aeromonas hydrophila]|uniref:Integral membrane protein AefA/O-antigen flippase n=1 Tax=Aeromonas hydrophila TaxID=644 RepID=A0A068FS18_AERHY|nr:oligosaccharide flippase family protein [Aeromonas hydrophila]AID70927.1 integral membrane protein AefA/O-antigen flippase [Aeromonas hydrophila]AID71008.1 integral membrane protein AefA/O-antigen flippase [Aeromonas hydrophila]EJN6953611.1 oligosaccharide flippase family protein [Aeromonas hydrophila]EJN6958056.1 oligosaccharide flippase family protein [Aeromonas hydrophila]MBW3796995.1 oligosaccharide flippase family protein [Aeromonas hydrophila]